MKYRARNKKRDANEPEIVKALEAAGVDVVRLDQPVDLICGINGITFLLEVKNPDGKNRLEPHQEKFIESWQGRPVDVVTNPDDALRAVGIGVSSLAVTRRQA